MQCNMLYNISSTKMIWQLAEKNYPDEYRRKKNILVSIGRLNTQKGFDLAIQAAKIIEEKGVEFTWFIIGEGEDEQMLREQIKKERLDDSVKLVGIRKNPYPYIRYADVFVQPSRYYIQNRDICKNVLDLQGGAKGHTVSSVIVLTSELSLYRHTSEFKTPYLDSGIYLMNLLYALTYYGIGTCPLIWNDDGEKAEEIRRFVDIPWSEQIVAIIQVGHYATNECKYAASNRRAVFDVLKIH